MDKNAIKKYAVWARRELISRVSQRAALFEITDKGYGDASTDSVLGRVLSSEEKRQRQALITQIREKGYEQVMEEVAYTWFNRLAALRFMEVNGYLPSHVRVFTDDENRFKPQILTEAINMELNGLDMEKVYALKNANDDDALFKYLIIIQCNALSDILPGMFQKISDYTELLFPDNLLREGSVIEQMVSMIPEEDWTDQVQVIGWLYQYYNTEPKDKVFADLKKNIKISKENIPAATQLFTPDWIVRYMVENSLGRLWLEGHPNDALKSEWKYYLDEAEQEPEVSAQLAEIRKEYAALKPEEIKVVDPCCGSGHILVYMFDMLVQIYEDYGYTAREAAAYIVERNLWGLDIDERAAQLTYFSVMMKARQYDRRFFSRGVQPHVYAIIDSNGMTTAPLHDMGLELSEEEYGIAVKQAWRLIEEMRDAREYGSILRVSEADWDLLRRFAIPRWESEGGQIPMEIHGEIKAAPRLQKLINLGQALSQKYNVVVTNPPYMGASGMGAKLSDFVKKNYPDSKSDLFAVFIERCGTMTVKNGYQAMITQHAWMFLSSFEKLRAKLQKVDTVNMAHLGARAFDEIGGEVVQTTSFIFRQRHFKDYTGTYCRLIDPTTQQGKEDMFLACENRYFSKQDDFSNIPGSPVAYWVSKKMLALFSNKKMSSIAECRKGLDSGDNNRFLRFWFEVPLNEICFNSFSGEDILWCPINKGGSCRKWYGNNLYIVWWKENAKDIRNHPAAYPRNISYSFKQGFTWSSISTGMFSARFTDGHFAFDSTGSMGFTNDQEQTISLLGFLNSAVCYEFLKIMEPTFHYSAGTIARLPVLSIDSAENIIHRLSKECIAISQDDWDAFETSWDFQRHPLLPHLPLGSETVFFDKDNRLCSLTHMCTTIAAEYAIWEDECDQRFRKLKGNEEELNRIFNDIYGLQDELTPEVEDKDVTVRKADLQREIKSLISYAVGCMFGRYSLDKKGLVFASREIGDCFRQGHSPFITGDGQQLLTADGKILAARDEDYTEIRIDGEWKACTYPVDRDNILPICDDDYFEDDIVCRFIQFVEAVYGKDTLEENLRFIANALGGKGSAREVIRAYFLNDFYADHLKVYQKRPIYWLFDSGKKNGFKCLIYMHRYQPDTIARIRTDYVHEQQSRYRTAIADLEQRINGAPTSERVKLTKQLATLQAQAEEIRVYEEKIHHLADQMIKIDLDDGVKHNYALFQDVLARIK